MLHAKNLPYHFWIEAINTSSHTHNCVTLRPGTKVTQYEMWRGRKPNVKYFHAFVANVISFKIESKDESWILRVMKGSSWDIPQMVRDIVCSII